MPWYRIPFNMTERARRAVNELDGEVPNALLELLRTANKGDGISDVQHAGGVVHLNFGRAGDNRAPAPCSICGWISSRLCDFKMPDGRDCDRPLCDCCTSSPAPGKDLCPEHAIRVKAWLAGRTNTTDGAG